MVASVVRRMPNASYSGSRAGTQIRKVTAPEPSRWTTAARMAVPMPILTGSVPTRFRIPLMRGRKVPASVRIPKNRMEKMNMTPVAATEPMPLEPVIMSPRDLKLATKSTTPCVPSAAPSGTTAMKKQEMMPVTTGTTMRATSGDAFLVMISTSMIMTVRNPRIAKGDIRITSSFIQATSPHAACSKRISNPDAKVKERGRGIKKQSLQYLGGTAGREEKSMISKILEF